MLLLVWSLAVLLVCPTTLKYLETELVSEEEEDEQPIKVAEDEAADILKQIEIQRQRIAVTEKEVSKHPFSFISAVVSEIMENKNKTSEGIALRKALQSARKSGTAQEEETVAPLTGEQGLQPEELCTYSKAAIVIRRKSRKTANANPGQVDPEKS